MTIHKSQGQSLSVVGVDLRIDYFFHGQCYVAFSQTSDARAVHVLLNQDEGLTVKNVVYRDI